MKPIKVFISSVQKEFAEERKALAQYFREDDLLNTFFMPFLFEEVAANTKTPGAVYLAEVASSVIYIGLLGNEYGYEDASGISPTEREYNHAKLQGLHKWIYIQGNSEKNRHPKELNFIRIVGEDVSRKRYTTREELKKEVYNSCIRYLKQTGRIESRDFDDSLHFNATLNDIDKVLIKQFVNTAKEKRNFPLKDTAAVAEVLRHLNMYREDKLVNSALLAFSKNPQKFFTTATIKCAHFHGTIVEKPIPDYKEFGGTVFEMAEQAVDFILSKISLSTGIRNNSNQVSTTYEIPRRAIAEAIINAVAHRDYYSKGSIQVSVFKNRVEVLNPGTLPDELDLTDLEKAHGSYPFNPLLAACMFLTGDIERFGTGTLEIFNLYKEADLIAPSFNIDEGFKVVLWRLSAVRDEVTAQVTAHDAAHDTAHEPLYFEINDLKERLVWIIKGEMNREEIMRKLDLKHRQHFQKNYIEPALLMKLVEMTLPDKPTSKNQKYKLTKKGSTLQKKLKP